MVSKFYLIERDTGRIVEEVEGSYADFLESGWGGACYCLVFDKYGEPYFHRGTGVLDRSKVWSPTPYIPPLDRYAPKKYTPNSPELKNSPELNLSTGDRSGVFVKIKTCKECPHSLDRTYCTHPFFEKWQFPPNPGGSIPNWCPLKN